MQKSWTGVSQEEMSKVAKEILSFLKPRTDSATVVFMRGDLGAGKTHLVKEIAKILGLSDSIQSPTFVIQKSYFLDKEKANGFTNLVHTDLYRLSDEPDANTINISDTFLKPNTLFFVEWPEILLPELHPKDVFEISISIADNEFHKRNIELRGPGQM